MDTPDPVDPMRTRILRTHVICVLQKELVEVMAESPRKVRQLYERRRSHYERRRSAGREAIRWRKWFSIHSVSLGSHGTRRIAMRLMDAASFLECFFRMLHLHCNCSK